MSNWFLIILLILLRFLFNYLQIIFVFFSARFDIPQSLGYGHNSWCKQSYGVRCWTLMWCELAHELEHAARVDAHAMFDKLKVRTGMAFHIVFVCALECVLKAF